MNWWGLIALAVVLGAFGYLVFAQPEGAPAGGGGQGPGAGQTFAQVQKELADYKDRLARNPVDTDALKGLYSMFGQIGRAAEAKPYLDKALSEVRQQLDSGKLKKDAALNTVLDISVAAMEGGGDPLGSVEAMKYYYELNPARTITAVIIANIYYDLGHDKEALEWYDKYLQNADPQVVGPDYINAQVDRATVRMQLAKNGDPAQLQLALDELDKLSKENPANWPVRFNLGHAQAQQGDKTKARSSFTKAIALAKDADQKWRSEAALAELEGRPAPPRPPEADTAHAGMTMDGANPHAGLDMGATGDPHAGLDLGGGAPPNPHSGAGE